MVKLETKLNKRNIQVKLLQNNNIPYIVNEAKTNRLSLRFNREGVLVVRKPIHMPCDKMELFIEKNIEWVLKNYSVYKKVERNYLDEEEYLYLGKKYYLSINENKHQAVHLHENKMYVFVPKNQTAEKVIEKWRKEEAEKVLSEILYACFKKMDEYFNIYPKLEIKAYKARWGTCYPKKNKISLNLSLIHVDVDLIEYVVFHELCHFIHLDHSPLFHKTLRKYVPDEAKKRQRLKKYKCYYK